MIGAASDRGLTRFERADPRLLTLPSSDSLLILCRQRDRWLAQGKVSRVPIGAFRAGLALSVVEVDPEEVECMVANMIYKVRRAFLSSYLCIRLADLIDTDSSTQPWSHRDT